MSFHDPASPGQPRPQLTPEPDEPRLQTRRTPSDDDQPAHTPAVHPVRSRPARPARAWRAGKLLTMLLSIALLVTLLGMLYARHALRSAAADALPQVDGRLVLGGLAAPVTVERDAQGVPSIKAASLDDLVYAQGFVTAGDRLFQMDLLRRHAAGTLAEVFGPATLAHDTLQRTLMIPGAADAGLAALPAQQRHLLESYARGVNAAIAAGHLPVEFTALHYTPAPWTPRDSLLVALAMFEDLTNAYPSKLAREALSARLPAPLVADLYPVGSWRDHPPAAALPDLTVPGPPFEQVPLDESQSSLRLAPAAPGAPEALPAPGPECTPGSNNWAVSGAHTATGKPLLANDMHLAHSMPGVWYAVNLQAPLGDRPEPLRVGGVSLPGIPLVVVGHNAHIAWGFTVLGADVQDVYIETLRGEGSGRAFQAADGSWQPLVHRAEHIRVRGGRDLDLDVAATVHGGVATPILNPVLPAAATAPGGQPRTLALRWSIYDPRALALPVLAIDSAHDWASFLDALSTFGGPAQNVVYADDQGHIGYHAAGLIPLRGPAENQAASAAATLPADIATPVDVDSATRTPDLRRTPGALAGTELEGPAAPVAPLLSGPLSPVPLVPAPAHEWSGTIPFDRLPQVFDPPGGIVATANARTTPDDYPYPITLNWAAPYRADRIYHALAGRNGLIAGDMLALESDVYSDFDHVLAERLAYAIDHAPSLTGGRRAERDTLRQAADLLRTFDGRMTTDSSAAAIVFCTHAVLWPMLLEGKLGKGVDDAQVNALYLWGERDYALEQVLAHTPPRWLSAPFTNWDDLLAAAVLRGLTTAKAPAKLQDWHYGQMHPVDLEHPVFGAYPLLARLLGMRTGTGPQPQPGDTTTVRQVARSFGPSERFVADLADPNRSTLNLVAGESGNPASEHYLDQFTHWLRGTSYAFPLGAGNAAHTLTLQPR